MPLSWHKPGILFMVLLSSGPKELPLQLLLHPQVHNAVEPGAAGDARLVTVSGTEVCAAQSLLLLLLSPSWSLQSHCCSSRSSKAWLPAGCHCWLCCCCCCCCCCCLPIGGC